VCRGWGVGKREGGVEWEGGWVRKRFRGDEVGGGGGGGGGDSAEKELEKGRGGGGGG